MFAADAIVPASVERSVMVIPKASFQKAFPGPTVRLYKALTGNNEGVTQSLCGGDICLIGKKDQPKKGKNKKNILQVITCLILVVSI